MELYQTLDINLKLKQEKDVSLLNRLAKEHQLKIVKQNQFMSLWYTVSITPETEKTTIEIANLLFETHLFDAVSPDFIFDGLEILENYGDCTTLSIWVRICPFALHGITLQDKELKLLLWIKVLS